MKTKTVKFSTKDASGRVMNITYHNFPILSKKELSDMKKNNPVMYQRLLAC